MKIVCNKQKILVFKDPGDIWINWNEICMLETKVKEGELQNPENFWLYLFVFF
jgi:hypothetical protein